MLIKHRGSLLILLQSLEAIRREFNSSSSIYRHDDGLKTLFQDITFPHHGMESDDAYVSEITWHI